MTQLRNPVVLRACGHGHRQQAEAAKGEAYRQWRHTRGPCGPAPGHARAGRTVHAVRTADTVRVRGRATVRPSQSTVNIPVGKRTRSTERPEHIRIEARARSWEVKSPTTQTAPQSTTHPSGEP